MARLKKMSNKKKEKFKKTVWPKKKEKFWNSVNEILIGR